MTDWRAILDDDLRLIDGLSPAAAVAELADRGVLPTWAAGDPMPFAHRDRVKRRLAEVLSLAAPFAG